MAKKMRHLRFLNLETGRKWTVKLTPKRDTFERLAFAHVRRIYYYVLPGAHGVNGPELSASALYDDGTEADVTVEFVREGWRLWLESDTYEFLEDVPTAHIARRRRLEAFRACWRSAEPMPEQEAELEAARFAERVAMDLEEARTRPGARTPAVTVDQDPPAPAAEVPAAEEPAAVAVVAGPSKKASKPTVTEMLAALADLPCPERAARPTSVAPIAEPDLLPAVIAAVHSCLRVLAGAGDLGRDRAFIWVQAGKQELTPAQARACRKILDRHRGLLPVNLVALAMGEVDPDPVPDAAPEPVSAAEPAEPATKRGRGRPPKNGVAMSAAERNKSWRASKAIVSLEVPNALADRLRAARATRGMSMADLLEAALSALENQEPERLAA